MAAVSELIYISRVYSSPNFQHESHSYLQHGPMDHKMLVNVK